MKNYFAKYLPVEGEIKEGNNIAWWIDDKHGEVVKATSNGGYPEKYKVTKLFLCSRDIQVGDEIKADYVVDGTSDGLGIIRFEKEGKVLREAFTDHWEIATKSGREYARKDGCYKVIGEISPDALSFVKEGDEFDEEQVRKAVYVELYYADAEEQWQNSIQYVSVEQTYQPKIISKTYYETVLHEVIEVKGSCNHFH